MKIPVNFGAGGGDNSDDCTATAEDVLESKTAVYNGSDDDAAYGSMKDYSGNTVSASASLDTTNSRVQMTVPNTGKYSTGSKLYATYAAIRELIGYTDASKVLAGTTFLGMAGTMADKSGSASSATATLDSSNSRVRMTIPSNGYYNTSAYLYTSYSSLASVIGLTAAKLGYGQTCLGVTGSYKPTVKNITAMAYRGFGLSSSQYETSDETSFTCPAAGNCYYSGIAAYYNGAGNGTCEIYKNNVLQNSRNSGEGYITRTTMVGQSFSVAAGDVIKVSCTATSGTHMLAFITADIVYYA